MKPWFFVIVFFLILSTVLYVYYERKTEKFYYAGTVEATEVDIPSRLSSVLDSVYVREGDNIKKNQKLADLSCDELKIKYALAQKDYERAKSLLDAGSLNEEAFDQIKFKKDDLQLRLSWGEITSPIEGTVLTIYHEPGEWVNPGSRILTVADLSRVWAYVYVPEPILSKIALGMKVDGFFTDGYGERTDVKGMIVKINDEAEFTPKNVQTRKERTRLVFGVKIEFENQRGFLKPGMSVEMSLPD